MVNREKLTDDKDRKRFQAKVDRNGPIPGHCPELGPCHVWTAKCNWRGYGQFHFNRRLEPAPRVAFFFAHGRWPETHACHRCDNPSCVNETHLFEGTHADNMADMIAKGRHAHGERNGSRLYPERCSRRGESNGRSKLTEQTVRDVVANKLLCRVSRAELGRRFGVSDVMVGLIMNGKAWSDVTGISPKESK